MRTLLSKYDKKKVKYFDSHEDAFECYQTRYKKGCVNPSEYWITKKHWDDHHRLPLHLEDSEIIYKCPTSNLDNFLT